MPFYKQNSDAKLECIGMNLESNEQLQMVIRKHWIASAINIFLGLVMLGISLGVYFIGVFLTLPPLLMIITSIGLVMLGSQYIFAHWINNELDVIVLTDRRVVALEQINFLDRRISQTTIDNIQEVNATTSGLLGNIFNFGTLYIKTASDSSGDLSDFRISAIPNPIESSRIIHEIIDTYRHIEKD